MSYKYKTFSAPIAIAASFALFLSYKNTKKVIILSLHFHDCT